MTTVHYDKLSLQELRVGDIVELLPDIGLEFSKCLVTDIHSISYPTIPDIEWVDFMRPMAGIDTEGKVYQHTETFTAARDHKGLFYSVSRDVQLYENQIIRYQDIDYRVIKVNPNGNVLLENALYIGNSSQLGFVEVPETKLNWKNIYHGGGNGIQSYDWESPDLLFYNPYDKKIMSYSFYQGENAQNTILNRKLAADRKAGKL